METKDNKYEDDDFEEEFNEIAFNKGKTSLYSSIAENKESKEYFKVAMQGFVWIFMFAVSALAMFLIFKTPYYTYYNNTAPIVLEEGGDIIEENFFAQNQKDISKGTAITEQDTLSSLIEESMITETAKDSPEEVQEQIQVLQNPPQVQNIPTAISPVENKPDTEMTALLKQSSVQENNAKKGKNTSSLIPLLGKNTNVKPKIEDTVTTKEKSNTIQVQKVSPKASSSITGSSSANTQSNTKAWFVSIYSSKTKNGLENKIKQLRASYKVINKPDVTFSIIDNSSNGIPSYRIGVSASSSNYFTSADEARKYCNTLKQEGLDCFIATSDLGKVSFYK